MHNRLQSIKIQYSTPHPDGSGQLLNCSGVLLIPEKKDKNYRIIIANPPTYFLENTTPSRFFESKNLNIFKREYETPYLLYFLKQARQGFAVLVPDYPGFGDSYQKCFHPYMIQKALVQSDIDFIKASQNKMKEEGYNFQDEILIEGYSQGAWVSTALAKELENNSTHNIKVKAVSIGGAPENLWQLLEIAQQKEKFRYPLFYYAYFGYRENGLLPKLDSTQLSEYESKAFSYYDGTHGGLGIVTGISRKMKHYFKEELLPLYLQEDPSSEYSFKKLLLENSVEPWKNEFEMRMYHAKNDKIVFYPIGKDFAEKQKNLGGNVTFHTVQGGHLTAMIPYFNATIKWFEEMK